MMGVESRMNFFYFMQKEPCKGVFLVIYNKVKFLVPKTKLTKVMKSPYYRGISLWDMLPEEVQRGTTKVRFKKQIA